MLQYITFKQDAGPIVTIEAIGLLGSSMWMNSLGEQEGQSFRSLLEQSALLWWLLARWDLQ